MERLIGLLPPRPQSLGTRFGWATAIMAIAGILQLVVLRFAGVPGLFILLIGVFATAFIFSRGTGLYAASLAVTAAFYVFLRHNLYVPTLAGVLTFALIAVAVGLFGEALRKTLERALDAERTSAMLLRELQHRTQNTLAVMVSLLEHQARSARSEDIKVALAAAAGRVRVQSEAHRHLALGQSGKVDAQKYLGEVCSLLAQTIDGVRPIAINCRAEQIYVEANKALAIGLIANELVTNALKYAFRTKESGVVNVSLARDASGAVRLTIADDGDGCPDDSTPGLGSQIVSAFAQEYGGSYSRTNTFPGCEVVVTLLPKPAAG